jgi:hypothetical protein
MLDGLDPAGYQRCIERIAENRVNRIVELLPSSLTDLRVRLDRRLATCRRRNSNLGRGTGGR